MKSFEERLERLEELGSSIRDNSLPLEEAVKLFEEGMKLSRSLEKDLGRIERKVEILINSPEGPDDRPELELFPELSSDSSDDQSSPSGS